MSSVFFYPAVGVIFEKYILSSGHKLADVDPAGTLDSYSGTKNEQKNKQNNVIEVEIRTLFTQVYRLPSHANPVLENFVIMFDSFTR